MAVQKSRKTRAKRNMRRAHDHLHGVAISNDAVTGSEHLRHHISADGYYRGREIIAPKVSKDEEQDEE